MFQSRSNQGKPSRGPSLSVSTTITRQSTSTPPSTAPIDTPISAYSLEEPSCVLPYPKDKGRSIASPSTSRRETWPMTAPTRKVPPPDCKVAHEALVEACGDEHSRREEHDQFGCTSPYHPATKSVTPKQLSGQPGGSLLDISSVRPSSGKQARAIGEPLDTPSGNTPGQMSSGKRAGQRTIKAQVEDVPSVEAKVAETRTRIKKLTATRGTLDEELNELTAKREKLQDEIAYYVKVKVERSKLSLNTAAAQPNRSRTAPSASERATPILSALFLLHSIVTSDTQQ